MEVGQKLFVGALSVLTLCFGLYLLIYETRAVSIMLDVVKHQIKDEEIYRQYSDNIMEEISFAEMISILMNELEYDIEINGALIRVSEHDIDKIDNYSLTVGPYLKQYQYDENGNILLIIYTSVN